MTDPPKGRVASKKERKQENEHTRWLAKVHPTLIHTVQFYNTYQEPDDGGDDADDGDDDGAAADARQWRIPRRHPMPQNLHRTSQTLAANIVFVVPVAAVASAEEQNW